MTRIVGWIGLGRIGAPMARRVLAAGHDVRLWARRASSARAMLDEGARWVEDPEALARTADIVATVVTGPDDVRELYLRMLPGARRGSVFVDLTTASPRTAVESAALAAKCGVHVLDAPITGGVAAAQNGTLTAFVGGEAQALDRARPLLDAFCGRVVHCGHAGNGYRMKLVNQTIVAGTLLGMANGARLAQTFAFDAAFVTDALHDGTAAGRLFEAYIARMMPPCGPATFTLGMLRKDVRLARDEAIASGNAAFHDFVLAALDAACERHGEAAGVQFLAASDHAVK